MSKRELVDEAALRSSFETLEVRQSLLEGLWSAGSSSSFMPTREAWKSRKPQAIGRAIHQLLASGESTLRIRALNDAALARREETLGRIGLTYSRICDEDPIHAAEVTGVTNIAMGRSWDKTLPLLRLMEYGNTNVEQNFVVSVPDMAYYLQSQQAIIELA
jgi:hypothetical protein